MVFCHSIPLFSTMSSNGNLITNGKIAFNHRSRSNFEKPLRSCFKTQEMSKRFKIYLLIMIVWSIILNTWGCTEPTITPDQFTLTSMVSKYPFSDGTYRHFARLELLFEGHPRIAEINGERITQWCRFEGVKTLYRDLDLNDGDMVNINGQIKYYESD